MCDCGTGDSVQYNWEVQDNKTQVGFYLLAQQCSIPTLLELCVDQIAKSFPGQNNVDDCHVLI